jgi:hypothetical protein
VDTYRDRASRSVRGCTSHIGFRMQVAGYTPHGPRGGLEGKGMGMVILLLLLLVLILAGAGFALHVLWIAAIVFAVFWLAGVALGRGEGAGTHRFYRW